MQIDSSTKIKIKIGNKFLYSNLMLAPMAGITDTVLRRLVRSFNPNCLLVTEMLSSEALVNNPNATILASTKDESPISFQLSGHKPDLMARAAKIIENKADFIDINMGCPVNKVVKGQDGSALMKNPALAAEIVKSVKSVINIPLTVKFRLGWSAETKNYVQFGQLMQQAGADAITIHARTRTQMYSGQPDWKAIASLKSAVDIPIFANGNIFDVCSANLCLQHSNADGLAIGRGALGNPFLFKDLDAFFKSGILPQPVSLKEKISVLLLHLNAEIQHRGEMNGIKFFRKFYPYYIKGSKNSSIFRQKLVTEDNYSNILMILKEIEDFNQDILL